MMTYELHAEPLIPYAAGGASCVTCLSHNTTESCVLKLSYLNSVTGSVECLLVCDAVYSGASLATFRREVLPPFSE
jgi:hypothetical protein